MKNARILISTVWVVAILFIYLFQFRDFFDPVTEVLLGFKF